ncbi:MAG: rubredoxin [Methanobacterium sp.]|nr:rubredoxin [Methanobacterium sp.]
MKRYKCRVCNYIYDPEKGEPRRDTPPGTPFEELNDNWRCPKCNAPKYKFIPLNN